MVTISLVAIPKHFKCSIMGIDIWAKVIVPPSSLVRQGHDNSQAHPSHSMGPFKFLLGETLVFFSANYWNVSLLNQAAVFATGWMNRNRTTWKYGLVFPVIPSCVGHQSPCCVLLCLSSLSRDCWQELKEPFTTVNPNSHQSVGKNNSCHILPMKSTQ
jgi:hypothetical protein